MRLDAVGVYGAMGATTPRFASGEATSPPLSDLLRRVAARRSEAVRITAEILRTRLMNNDVALIVLVEQARRANEQRPERHQLDLDRAMASVKGE